MTIDLDYLKVVLTELKAFRGNLSNLEYKNLLDKQIRDIEKEIEVRGGK